MALFIALEGIDGAGKTTQAQRLIQRLAASYTLSTLVLHEPGGTLLGEEIGVLLKHNTEAPIAPEAELLLFLASRAQLVREVIRPALRDGTTVLCDRFSASTLAYQGYGRGLDLEKIRALLDFSTEGLAPDLTILLDVPVRVGLGRKKKDENPGQLSFFNREEYDRFRRDRFHDEDSPFHEKVRQGYLKLSDAAMKDSSQGNWAKIDGTLPVHEVSYLIWENVEPLLKG